MINKQNLWFITLFSLILVLSIYYLTMSDDALAALAQDVNNKEDVATVEVSSSNVLVALRVQEEENVLAEMEKLQTVLLDDSATLEEKNDAYNSLQALNTNKGKEDEIEAKIKETHKLDSFVKIDGDQISIVIASNDHSPEIANKIIRTVQSMYDVRMYITVKFQN
ncbi:MAG: SpoIIIAH-like family protein [Bacilli bacterium]|nr:SpoIIIAH-like family protein [Bacilli bacterium]